MASAELQLLLRLKDEASKELGGVAEKLGNVGKVAAGVAAGLAAATGAVAAFAIGSAVKFSQVGDEVQKMSIRTGIAAESISALRVAADASGTSIGSVESGIKKMQLSLVELSGDSKKAADAFSGLGIKLKDIK